MLDYHDANNVEAMFLDPKLNPRCNECQSMDIDQTYKKVFGYLVCNKCKNEKTEKYSLLTKTECKEVYCFITREFSKLLTSYFTGLSFDRWYAILNKTNSDFLSSDTVYQLNYGIKRFFRTS